MADQGGENAQQGNIVVQGARAEAGAVAGEYAECAVVCGNRQRDEHGFFVGQLVALYGTGEEKRVFADVVGHNHVGVGQYRAGNTFVGGVNTARHLFGRHAVGIDDGGVFVVGMLQNDAALVEAE